MKRFLGLAIGLFLVIGFTSSAEAIQIKIGEVQNGVAFIKGDAEERSAITWEGHLVTSANPGGEFSFNGVVPADCVGTLSDGTSTIEVVVLDCTPVSVASAQVPRTGQTTSYAAGDDGALQKGVAWPNPRFTDNNNGTITDNLTGLIWLKNANCIGTLNPVFDNDGTPRDGRVIWQHALDFVAGINTGTYNCGDTSNGGFNQTDWRLPNVRELQSLVDYGTANPAPALPAGHPFINFVTEFYSIYWSSTTFDCRPPTCATNSTNWWAVGFTFGGNVNFFDNTNHWYVIAVRGGS